jgi:protease-4
MKKLLAIYLLLVGAAILAAALVVGLGAGQGLSTPIVLVWHIAGTLPERSNGGYPFLRSEEQSLASIYPALRAARADSRVRGLAVYIEDARFGLAKAQELRRQILELRRAGKFAGCYLETAGEAANGTLPYFLATACDEITLAPLGEVNMLGLYAQTLHLRGTLDKLKIDPEFLRIGPYKSATETYTESHSSPAAAEALSAVLDSYYGQIVTAIAAARRLPPARVRQLIDAAPFSAPAARAAGLVDRLAYADEFRHEIARRAGGKARLVALAGYPASFSPRGATRGGQIAVVVVAGAIERGSPGGGPFAGEELVGSDEVAEILSEAGRNSSIAAVVLRIDSPGGSALASDLILHAVERLHRRKPVIVSMSDVAASGGYYIASRADKIVAEPATLTGSIGVLTGKLVTRRFEQEILGLDRDTAQRGADANLYSTLTPFSPAQEAKVRRQIAAIYSAFVGHVAAGRHLSRAAVEAIAGGRVWSGADALRLGLVDALGGLDAAIALAREAAHVPGGEEVEVRFYPGPPGWLDFWRGRQVSPLPESLLRLAARLERPVPRLLELPPEVADLTHPF